MSAFENAKSFFEACETGGGWSACREFVAPGAGFEAQSEPLVDISTVEAYCEWMAGLANSIAPGCSYDLHAEAFDEDSNTALFFATFNGRHTGEGGPVPPTNKETNAHYVYALEMNEEGKIKKMTKVWNAPWTMRELGWA